MRDDVLAGQLGGLLALAGEQGPQTRIHALDIGLGQPGGEELVDVLEEVLDVGRRRGRVGLVEVPVRVRRPDDPVPSPGDDEEDRLLGAQDDAGTRVDPVAGHDQVDALGGPDVELAALADHRLGVVGPDAGRVDDLPRVDVELAPGHLVQRPDPGHPLALAEEPDRGDPRRDVRAVGRGRARELHGVPRVVDLRVVVLDGAGQLGLLQGRGDSQRGPSAQVLVPRQPAVVSGGPRQAVVEESPAST